MKKASFFIVLGLAILLLFGCAGGGGGLLGGISEKPVDTWFVELLDKYVSQYERKAHFLIKISVNATNDGYDAMAVDVEGEELQDIEVTFDFDKDKVKELKIKKGSEYEYILTGEFHDGDSNPEDLMFGKYTNSKDSNDKGVWFAVRENSSYLTGVLTGEGDSLEELETVIKGLIETTTGEKSVEIDLSELMK